MKSYEVKRTMVKTTPPFSRCGMKSSKIGSEIGRQLASNLQNFLSDETCKKFDSDVFKVPSVAAMTSTPDFGNRKKTHTYNVVEFERNSMTHLQVFESELAKRGIKWCKGGCGSHQNHVRGFADQANRTVHLERAVATRSTLHRALHEIGHIERDVKGLRRFELERNAEDFATTVMREHGISVPRTVTRSGSAYVRRMKRWGDNIAAGQKDGGVK